MDNPLAMSDEDFLKSGPPPVMEDDKQTTPPAEEVETPAADDETQTPEPEEKTGDEDVEDGEVKPEKDDATDPPATDKPALEDDTQPAATNDKAPPGKETGVVVKDAPGSKEATPAAPPNYEQLYTQLMAPFKANGKTIQLDSPEEAVALMKMGANYTKKMQELAPHRKLVTMLQNNDLLDEGKLSFLIDVSKKNPEAIKKLLKDGGIDPMEIDTTTEPAYQEGNHRVTDAEVRFTSTLEDVQTTQVGKETVQEINKNWDAVSKAALWEKPELMQLMADQRESGIYQRIADAIDKQKTLGKINSDTPFLHAYTQVGDQMAAAGLFDDIAKKNDAPPVRTPGKPAPKPVAVRAVVPKSEVANKDKVNAASPSRSTPREVKAFVNPLGQSDEDFMKQFKNR